MLIVIDGRRDHGQHGFVARTYRTLSLSLPHEVVAQLESLARAAGKTAARIAVEIVVRDIGMSTQPLETQLNVEGDTTVLHQCIVHEPTRPGMFAREHQTISLLDVTRIRGGKATVLDVFLGGRWLEIEGDFDAFRKLWETAKNTAAGIC